MKTATNESQTITVDHIVMDIEGTTTSLSFVKDVLFPYSLRHLEAFVLQNQGDSQVQAALDMVRETAEKENLGPVEQPMEALSLLAQWIDEDRKHPGLKKLQGLIWRQGYKDKAYVAHIYPDVFEVLPQWKKQGFALSIYSSGSVEAQKLLFAHTERGDLTSLFSHFFDTQVGAKTEANSYSNITSLLNAPAEKILFLSDMVRELDAAKEAGMQTVQLVRPGTQVAGTHAWAKDFYSIPVNKK